MYAAYIALVAFAVRASLLGSLVVAGLFAIAVAVQSSAEARVFVVAFVSLFLTNLLTIYLGVWLGAWGALRWIAHPKAITFTGVSED